MFVTDRSRALLPSQHGAEQGGLSFLRTAPRHLVDRTAVAEVLVTDWRRQDRDTFHLGAQWPRGHAFYTPIAGSWYDPLLAAETLRQSSFLIGHLFYGVPEGRHAVVDALDVDVVPSALLLGSRPAEVRLEISCGEVRREEGRLVGLTLEADFLRNDTHAGTGRVALRVLEPAAGAPDPAGRPRAVRETGALPEAVPAAVVGRLHESDVVLGVLKRQPPGDGRSWRLRIDPGHPVLFDHPADHVPPMLFLEAARQAAQAVCAPYRVLPAEVRSAFRAPAALDVPCTVTAVKLPLRDASEDAAVRVTAVQEGRLVFDSLVVAAFCD